MRSPRVLRTLAMTAILAMVPAFLFAGTNSKAGTSGAQFLKIGAGARPTAMGDAFVGVADDVNAVYFNPAGLATIDRPELIAMHTQWFQGMNYDFGAFALPSEHGTFGISAATLKADDLEKRNADESYEGNFESLDAAYSLSYAKEIKSLLSLGLTARYLKQEIDTASAGTWSGDVGIFKSFENHPFNIGFAVRHFGQEIKFNEESDPQPMTLDLGTGVRLLKNRVTIGLNIKKPNDNSIQYGTGGEYKRGLRNDFRFALRSGYTTAGTGADGTTGISMGGGIGYKSFDLDFAWVPFGDLGNTFRYAALMRF